MKQAFDILRASIEEFRRTWRFLGIELIVLALVMLLGLGVVLLVRRP